MVKLVQYDGFSRGSIFDYNTDIALPSATSATYPSESTWSSCKRCLQSKVDLVLAMVNLAVYVLDIVTDIWVATLSVNSGSGAHGWLMVTFIVLPSLVSSAFSAHFFLADYRARRRALQSPRKSRLAARLLLCVVQLSLLTRFADVVLWAFRYSRIRWRNATPAKHRPLAANECDETDLGVSRPNAVQTHSLPLERVRRKFHNRQLDLFFIGLVEACLESAPQLVIQMSKILADILHATTPVYPKLVQSLGLAVSAVTISWAPVRYYIILRKTHRPTDRRISLVTAWTLLFPWRLLTTIGRVLAIGWVFSSLGWTVGVVGLCGHWAVWTLVLIGMDRSGERGFCAGGVLMRIGWLAVLSGIHTLLYLNTHEGATRHRYALYYVVFYIENVLMGVVCFLQRPSHHSELLPLCLLLFIVFGFWVGLLFKGVYYWRAHPNKQVAKQQQKQSAAALSTPGAVSADDSAQASNSHSLIPPNALLTN